MFLSKAFDALAPRWLTALAYCFRRLSLAYSDALAPRWLAALLLPAMTQIRRCLLPWQAAAMRLPACQLRRDREKQLQRGCAEADRQSLLRVSSESIIASGFIRINHCSGFIRINHCFAFHQNQSPAAQRPSPSAVAGAGVGATRGQ